MSKLFSPISIGAVNVAHRIVMAPLTRSRADLPNDVPNDLMVEYYSQRASEGGLIIGEASTISMSARGWLGAPGLYSRKQVEGWRRITAAVHAKGGVMFAQLWHTGRSSHISVTGGSAAPSPPLNKSFFYYPLRFNST